MILLVSDGTPDLMTVLVSDGTLCDTVAGSEKCMQSVTYSTPVHSESVHPG